MRRRRSGTLNILRTAARNFSMFTSGGRFELTCDFYYCTTSLFDLLTSALGEAMCRNAQRLRYLTVAENHNIVLRLFNDTSIVQNLRRDLLVSAEMLVQCGQTYFKPLLLEDICESTLGKSAMKWHLPTFESNLARIARTRLLPFFTASSGLAQT